MTLFGYEFTFPVYNSKHQKGSSKGQNIRFSLAQVKPGRQVKVKEFSPGLSSGRTWQLQSYGVMPGCWLRVIQQSPVTIIQVEHLELALECELAAMIQVDGI
jgi:Fe2+ transport system protein FeoA